MERGWIEIRGLAWSGRGKVSRVEVSTDAGKSWQRAELQEPPRSSATRAISAPVALERGGEIMSRVTDETGYVQPTFAQLIDARGADTGGYHLNPITVWQIKSDGRVLNRPENGR
ncbi:hypothetical protein GCM10027423_43960 [Spirosoma arcticum]